MVLGSTRRTEIKSCLGKYHSDDSVMRDKERTHTLPQITEGGGNVTQKQWTLISQTGKAKGLLLVS